MVCIECSVLRVWEAQFMVCIECSALCVWEAQYGVHWRLSMVWYALEAQYGVYWRFSMVCTGGSVWCALSLGSRPPPFRARFNYS